MYKQENSVRDTGHVFMGKLCLEPLCNKKGVGEVEEGEMNDYTNSCVYKAVHY